MDFMLPKAPGWKFAKILKAIQWLFRVQLFSFRGGILPWSHQARRRELQALHPLDAILDIRWSAARKSRHTNTSR